MIPQKCPKNEKLDTLNTDDTINDILFTFAASENDAVWVNSLFMAFICQHFIR